MMKVDVYQNLQKDCLSVRSREREDYGKVVSHEEKVHVSDVEFVVQDAGWRKARETGIKNVHAFVRGEWNESEKVIDGTVIKYDPFGVGAFYEVSTGRIVTAADRVAVINGKVFAEGVEYE